MWIRRKWIVYHFLGSIGAVLACGTVSASLLPNSVSIPLNFPELFPVLAVSVIISAFIAVLGGYRSSKSIYDQLEAISLGAKNLAYGNLQYRLSFSGNSGMDSIVLAFNEMAERLESQVGALQKLAEENEQLLQEAKITAISEERQRLARDLHDAVSQQLFSIAMMAATASKIADQEPNRIASLVKEIAQSAGTAQSEMRALLLELRPLTLQNETLAEALKSLITELEGRQLIKCTLQLDKISLPKNIENQLFRIAQEALSNILRHSQAARAVVSLRVSEDQHRVFLIIEDDGRGFVPSAIPVSSFGIRSIKERATLLGGVAQWVTVPGQGTKLEVRIPIYSELDPGGGARGKN